MRVKLEHVLENLTESAILARILPPELDLLNVDLHGLCVVQLVVSRKEALIFRVDLSKSS